VTRPGGPPGRSCRASSVPRTPRRADPRSCPSTRPTSRSWTPSPNCAAPSGPRDLCTALDLTIAAKNVEGIRSKLKKLVNRGILTETEPGLSTQPRP
jgi:hypothetical protein